MLFIYLEKNVRNAENTKRKFSFLCNATYVPLEIFLMIEKNDNNKYYWYLILNSSLNNSKERPHHFRIEKTLIFIGFYVIMMHIGICLILDYIFNFLVEFIT